MKRPVGILLVSVLTHILVGALTFGFSAAAAQQDSGRTEKTKADKKRVKAVLIEPPATPVPSPTPMPTPVPATPGPASSAAKVTPPSTSGAPPATTGRDSPAFQERVEVTEVLLDAIVKKGGKVVTGLGPDDFVVTEEGRPVEVTSAKFYGAPEQLEATGDAGVERADRYFILLFHDRSRDATVIRPLLLDAGQQARKWVEEQRLPNDQVAVLSYDVRLKVHADFTRDTDQIEEAISRAVTSKKEPDRAAGHSKEPLRPMADSPSLLLNLPAGDDLARESRVFEKAMALLGRAAEGIVGRKNVLLFSIGFGDVDPNGVWVPDSRYYPALEQNLNNGDVAVYAIDLLGRSRGGPAGPGISSSLSSIAGDTAGFYFENFTSFKTPLQEVAKDTAGYYLLSYRSEYPRGTTGYRDVKVDTREKGYDVRARKGYLFGEEDQPLSIPDRKPDGDEDREPPTG